MFQVGICSFSFHRLLSAGRQDMFQYITDCKELGCTQLDPWNAHLASLKSGDEAMHAGQNPDQSAHLTAADDAYIDQVKSAADEAGLPFGCIAVDGAHVYEEDADKAKANRARAYRWIEIGRKLGATQLRIDTGGPEEMPDPVFEKIVEGYHDLIPRCRDAGIELLVENHWGPTKHPDNVVKLMEAIDGLGLLFDTWNWAPGKQAEGWLKCAKYARAMHVKTFHWTDEGEELTQHLGNAIRLLQSLGYDGAWGVESVPRDVDEIEGARRTIALIRRYAENG